MTRNFLASIFLLPVSSALAHLGEEVEEHAEGAVQAGPAVGSLIMVGVLAAAVIGFLIWIMIKK